MNTCKTLTPEKKLFYRSLLSLVIPITIQNLITNMVNSANTAFKNTLRNRAVQLISVLVLALSTLFNTQR